MPPGTYDVVTDPETSGVIAHEAFGHGMETDMFLKERARGGRVHRQAGRLRPGEHRGRSRRCRARTAATSSTTKGSRPAPTQIIRDGILQGGMTDLYSASRLGISRTANGRRESVQRKAYARMSNTFFSAARSTREELLGSLDDGVLLCQTRERDGGPEGLGHPDLGPCTRASTRGGKPTGRIFSPVAITGYVPDVLADVSMVVERLRHGWRQLRQGLEGDRAGRPRAVRYLRTRCRLA